MYNLLQSENEPGTIAKKFTDLYLPLGEDHMTFEDSLKNINLSLSDQLKVNNWSAGKL